ncbi:hypothetical protein [Roseobacter denitrificans]|nr:hypothetical protein [Roseobacter denitrificans]SFG05332.1 hypothetical protein SAMN05443635_106188 [Roseobacter denitrificans OCh 114]
MLLTDLSEAPDGDQIWTILERFYQRAGLEVPPRNDLVGRLLHACRGRFGLIIETVIDAIEVALDTGATSLTSEHFVEVFGAQTACDLSQNVFLTNRWSHVDMERLAFG